MNDVKLHHYAFFHQSVRIRKLGGAVISVVVVTKRVHGSVLFAPMKLVWLDHAARKTGRWRGLKRGLAPGFSLLALTSFSQS